MSGLLALLDDVAALAKAAAASVDDIASQSAQVGSKTAAVLIDDAAVTPQYVEGIDPRRELPIVWRITKGSLRNKLVFLLPIALLLASFAPWAITPLLMMGGAYLSYEGAEKIWHALFPAHGSGKDHPAGADGVDGSSGALVADGADGAGGAGGAAARPCAAHLEEEKARGAIRTDFILSAEIMTITLASLPPAPWWQQALVLAVVGIGVTVAVYGTVALIVKSDDIGLHLAREGRLRLTRAFGRVLVKAMPIVMDVLTIIGTAAMLWVGGSILVHGCEALGWPWPAVLVEHAAEALAHALPPVLADVGRWFAEAGIFALVGLGAGLVMLPLTAFLLSPLARAIARLPGR